MSVLVKERESTSGEPILAVVPSAHLVLSGPFVFAHVVPPSRMTQLEGPCAPGERGIIPGHLARTKPCLPQAPVFSLCHPWAHILLITSSCCNLLFPLHTLDTASLSSRIILTCLIHSFNKHPCMSQLSVAMTKYCRESIYL